MLEPEGSFSNSLMLQLESMEVKQGFPHSFLFFGFSCCYYCCSLFSRVNIYIIIQVQPFLWTINNCNIQVVKL